MAIKDLDRCPSVNQPICGVSVTLHDGGDILRYARSLDGYHSLCQWLSAAMMRSGHDRRALPDMHTSDLGRLAFLRQARITLPPVQADTDYREQARTIALFAPGDVYVGGYLMRDGCDEERLYCLSHEAAADDLGFVALGPCAVSLPGPASAGRCAQPVWQKTSLPEAGWLLSRNAERHLLAPDEMGAAGGGYEAALETADAIAASCRFSS